MQLQCLDGRMQMPLFAIMQAGGLLQKLQCHYVLGLQYDGSKLGIVTALAIWRDKTCPACT